MSILDHVAIRPTGNRNIDEFTRSPLIEFTKQKVTEVTADRCQDEWLLSATIGMRFGSDALNHRYALENAKKTLLRRIYAPLLGEIQELRQAIYDGDRRLCLLIVDKMQKEVGL